LKLYEPVTLKKFLARHGLSATRGLGQHFLCSGPVVSKIVESLQGYAGILEIGPGPGVLTGPLSEASERLIALELDRTMIGALKDSSPRAEARQVDALEADLSAILAELPEPRGLVSNLPYYITGPLLTRITESRAGFGKAVLMMQKEVAQRVMAKPGSSERGSLSVYLQAQFEIEFLVDAPAEAFLPPPKVDSRVLALIPRDTGLEPAQEAKLFPLIRKGFAQRRKTLVNNLIAGYGIDRDRAVGLVESLGLTEKSRPQELTLEHWKGLSFLV
jgi:16S rRNA (adenine1518-N6/adenine1519-N6)-dimethyltransferase